MFSKTFFVVAAFVAGALATESGRCSTSNQFCCDSFTDSKNPQVADICHSLGVPVDADVVVGLTCTPISVIAIAGNKCEQKPTCCNKYDNKSLVGVDCTPISALS